MKKVIILGLAGFGALCAGPVVCRARSPAIA
jgi:hypothetical protein